MSADPAERAVAWSMMATVEVAVPSWQAHLFGSSRPLGRAEGSVLALGTSAMVHVSALTFYKTSMR